MFEISQKAKERLQEVLASDACLLVSVSPGGCNGFSYKYDIAQKEPTDATCVYQSPAVYVANSALEILDGGKLEFEANDLGTAFFSIINPNATSKCGCGNSFSTF